MFKVLLPFRTGKMVSLFIVIRLCQSSQKHGSESYSRSFCEILEYGKLSSAVFTGALRRILCFCQVVISFVSLLYTRSAKQSCLLVSVGPKRTGDPVLKTIDMNHPRSKPSKKRAYFPYFLPYYRSCSVQQNRNIRTPFVYLLTPVAKDGRA